MSSINLEIFGSADPKAGYIGWSPAPLTVAGVSSSGTKSITLKSRSLNGSVSKLVFMARVGDKPQDEITIDLGDSNRTIVFVAGKWQDGLRHYGASQDSKDVAVDATWDDQAGEVPVSLELMIRVRKNANELSDKAREDFLDALAALNGIQTVSGAGKGIYVTDFVGMHVEGASDSEHGDSMFLPWHRLYLLDLERLLQKIIPEVTLPYWKFDEPAPQVFTEGFMGATESIPPVSEFTPGTSDKLATFALSNPLSQWQIGDVNGIPRAAFFNTQTEAAPGLPAAPGRAPFELLNQQQTLSLGGANHEFGALRNGFSGMEGTPHGAAHVSFNGYINSVPVAPQDPLFFLLHCNVDRLWAVWQFVYRRDEAEEKTSYPYQAKLDFTASLQGAITGTFPDPYKVISALQWPWDNTQSKPYNLRPPGTRSGNFTQSPTGKRMSGDIPSISDSMDAFGHHEINNYLGFAYDDVPFDYDRVIAAPEQMLA